MKYHLTIHYQVNFKKMVAAMWLLSMYFLPLLLVLNVNSTIPMQLAPRYLPEEGKGVCPSKDSRQAQRNNFDKDVADLLRQYLQTCDNGLASDSAVSSCADIPVTCESGMRYITTNDGKTESVYCETSPPFSNHTWMRLATLDMTDSSQSCPMHWTVYNNDEHKLRACGRNHNQEQKVAQAVFSTSGIMYSKVCGRITAYQLGATEAFTTNETATLADPYVDGVSITYGGNAEHIWTFAAARAQEDDISTAVCPCTNSKHETANIYIPSFVGSDYFCETGAPDSSAEDSTLYFDNLLWDGQSCYGSSTCCQFNSPPWFCKTLSSPTTQDIEVRIMNFASENQKLDGEDTVIETLYLYVQ